MQFYAIENLWLFTLVPCVALILYASRLLKNKKIAKLAYISTYIQMVSGRNMKIRTMRILLIFVILILSVVALCRPQWGREQKMITQKGLDVLFLLDTSKSMLARDVKPSRFDQAKQYVSRMMKELQGDRIGLVAFAQQSYLACPLTLDYSAFRLFLDSIDTRYIPIQGTSLYNAVQTALSALQDSDKQYDVIIVLSDGEDHLGGVKDIAQKIRKLGVRIYCIGIGTHKGVPVPIGSNVGVPEFLVDAHGNMVITKLQEGALRTLADMSGGLYYRSSNSYNEVDLIVEHIRALQKKEFEDVYVVQKEDQFQLFLIVIIILLVVDVCLMEKRKI